MQLHLGKQGDHANPVCPLLAHVSRHMQGQSAVSTLIAPVFLFHRPETDVIVFAEDGCCSFSPTP